MSEEEVIREIRKGGRAADVALRALYDGCARHMLRFFVYSGVSGDEAKDILQETLVRLVRHVDSYNGDGAARSWIWQIARNCLTDHQRRSGRWSELVVAVDDEQWDRIAETHASPAARPGGFRGPDARAGLGADPSDGRAEHRGDRRAPWPYCGGHQGVLVPMPQEDPAVHWALRRVDGVLRPR
jgi:RNA polymerase sigma factor (sigma-70 family)